MAGKTHPARDGGAGRPPSADPAFWVDGSRTPTGTELPELLHGYTGRHSEYQSHSARAPLKKRAGADLPERCEFPTPWENSEHCSIPRFATRRLPRATEKYETLAIATEMTYFEEVPSAAVLT